MITLKASVRVYRLGILCINAALIIMPKSEYRKNERGCCLGSSIRLPASSWWLKLYSPLPAWWCSSQCILLNFHNRNLVLLDFALHSYGDGRAVRLCQWFDACRNIKIGIYNRSQSWMRYPRLTPNEQHFSAFRYLPFCLWRPSGFPPYRRPHPRSS